MNIYPEKLNSTSHNIPLSSGIMKNSSLPTEIDTADKVSMSAGKTQIDGMNDKQLKNMALKGKVQHAVAVDVSETTDIKANDREISITIPFEKHLENASVFILEKTAKQYPGFANNIDGKSRKAVQISAHLRDFVEFVKKENPGDLATLSDKEMDGVIKSATGFVADKIGEEYGMAPHMRRNPIFLSPIQSNVGDYLEYLSKENITISADNDGNIIATKFFTKEAAMEALEGKESLITAPSGRNDNATGSAPGETKTIIKEGNQIIIGGIRLNINR